MLPQTGLQIYGVFSNLQKLFAKSFDISCGRFLGKLEMTAEATEIAAEAAEMTSILRCHLFGFRHTRLDLSYSLGIAWMSAEEITGITTAC